MNFIQIKNSNTNMFTVFFLVYALLYLAAYATPVLAEDAIGDVVFARGAVSAQSTGGQLRLLGKSAVIYRSDTITTGPKSFAVLKLNDGTRISVRPDTVLAINDYSEAPGKESASMRLFRGGLRAISGYISKRNPDAFKVRTAVATIGIRGTEFDARLCEADCAKEASDMTGKKTVIPQSVVGRVAFIKGKVSAKKEGKEIRTLTSGAPLYESDEITTDQNAYVVLVFRDQSRVTLKAETEFKIEKYNYDTEDPESDGSFFRLVKGGMRALSGVMSKRNPQTYKVRTAVATIGIRGTGFDLIWFGPCTTSPNCGLVASVWQGDISSDNDAGINAIGLNQSVRIGAINLAPQLLDSAPVFNVPRPDTLDVDFDNLFTTHSSSVTEPGLYVACYEGHCTMLQEGRELDLGAGEAGFADAQRLIRLQQIDPFQINDPYLNTINDVFSSLHEILDDSVISETEFECVVQ